LGVRIHPNSSTIMNFAGHAAVSNVFPEFKDEVSLDNLQSTTVARAQPPTRSMQITAEDRQQFINPQFMNHLATVSTGKEGVIDIGGPGAGTVIKDLGLNIGKSVTPSTNLRTQPGIIGGPVQATTQSEASLAGKGVPPAPPPPPPPPGGHR
jgi:hypothetical protein